MKMRNNSKTKHVEKKLIISNNKNNNYNSNNNDFKMGRITNCKRNKLWFELENGQVYTRLKNASTTRQKV